MAMNIVAGGCTGIPTMRPGTGVVYRGYGPPDGRTVVVEVNGRVIGTLPHVVKHSPTGMTWGYAGSGPADLARSMLIHALRARPDCAECGGTGRNCWFCDGGYTVPSPAMYQQFKFEAIARLPQNQSWSISQDSVLTWVAAWRSNNPDKEE
jgi:hypothetical protein